MKKELIRDSAQIIAGNFLVALGVNAFILPNDVLTGGLAGVAVALQPLVAIEPTLFINAATIVLFGIGAVILGRQFALKTLLSTICYPLFISLLSWGLAEWFTPETFIMDQYLAAIYGGVFMGCGVGLVFRCGASTGGMDIPPLIVHRFTHLPLSTLVLITDALGVATYGLQAALMGIISVFVSSVAIDRTLTLGAVRSKNCMIISAHPEELMAYIHEQLYRGTTLLEAKGGYTKEQRQVIMVVVSRKQYPLLEHEVLRIDPNAFIIVTDTDEVHGLGFTYEEDDYT